VTSHTELLQQIPLFAHFSPTELESLAGELERRTYAAGDVVVRAGDRGQEMYIVLEGEFQVFLRSEALDVEREIRRMKPGQFFGEISLIAGVQRTASVRAVVPSTALVMVRDVLRRLMLDSPSCALALCESLGTLLATAVTGVSAVPFVSLREFADVEKTHSLLAPRVSNLCKAIAVDRVDNRVRVALVHPEDESIRSFIRSALRQYTVEFVAIAEREFEEARVRWFGDFHDGRVSFLAPQDLTFTGLGTEEPFVGQDRPLDRIIADAIGQGAGDVHLEATPTGGRLRMRIDGLLFPAEQTWDHQQHQHIVTQVKVIAGLDTTGRRIPQDGQFMVGIGDRSVDVRISIIATSVGEKVVLRLLDPNQIRVSLDAIASPPANQLMRDLFYSSDGLVLVCGPTGAGKTTTLFAGLHEIWDHCSTQNIVTIEDPVEYHIGFSTQIQVNRQVGLDFPQIMRSVLRQDPDVILVGEIRDAESARIAIEAATTGHLVCSSLHTAFALDAVTRMRYLDVPPFLLAGALKGVVAQRLVPQVCKHCAKPIGADDAVVRRMVESGFLAEADVVWLRRGAGCSECRFLGDHGRTAVLEILIVDGKLRDAIEESAGGARLRDCLHAGNFISMQRYAKHLLRNGMVAPDHIARIFQVAQANGNGREMM
jgi:type II secretory ATPase GspE/PulE/Tfp pilus assembly ATPase PilB-like protein/CRP-like cAMP-binding protein